jgi:hypothetical protein
MKVMLRLTPSSINMSEARSQSVKSGIIGLSLDSAVSAEAKGWEALAVVELENGCGGRHGVSFVWVVWSYRMGGVVSVSER